MEQKLKHLEFIQAVVNRMSENSSLMRGWAVTVVAGVVALASSDSDAWWFAPILYLAITAFWLLDGFFIFQERLFRALYDDVRIRDESTIDFDMHVRRFCGSERTWVRSVFSLVPLIFYGFLIVGLLFITCLRRHHA